MSDAKAPLPAESQDQLLRVFAENGTTGLLHMVLDFSQPLDAGIVAVATRRLIDAEPILGCRFVENAKRATWHRREELDDNPGFRLQADVADVEAATQELVGRPFLPDDTPNFAIDLLRHAGGDRLVLSVSHVIADGGAVLEVATRFAALYTALVADADFRMPVNPASRNSLQWLKAFSFKNQLTVIARDFADIRRSMRRHLGLKRSFVDYKSAARTMPAFVVVDVPGDRVREIDAIARDRGLSRNDVLLAGFARAYAAFATSSSGGDEGQTGSVHIIMPSNLRRFMPADARPAICNLAGIANVFVEPDIGPTFTVTLERIETEMARQRKAFIGAGNPIAARFFDCVGLPRKRRLIAGMMEKGMRRPLPSAFTNVGRLSERKLTFDRVPPSRIALLSTPLSSPLTLIVVLGYKNTLSLSMGYYEDDFSYENVQRFLLDITASIVPT